MPDLEPAVLPSPLHNEKKKKKSKRKSQKDRSGAEGKRKEKGKKLGWGEGFDPRPVLSLAGPDPDLAKRKPHFSSSFPSSPLNEFPHFNNPHSSEPSFSQALKECQKQRVRSEVSPRFVQLSMSKSSTGSSRSRSGTFPSPGTPNYTRYGLTASSLQKGWSSERVPLHAQTTVLPLGKKLPSKWEDAEKWILSPVGRSVGPPAHHRRPKSKSGPLGGHTDGYAAGSVANSPAPFLIPENVGVSFGNCDGGGNNNGILRSVSINGWMDTLMEATAALPPSSKTKPEAKVQIPREAVDRLSASILRKDVATQMSSEGSAASSSPKEELSRSLSRSGSGRIEAAAGSDEGASARTEVRDVEVDGQVTVMRWSKRNVLRSFDKRDDTKDHGNWEDRERKRCADKSKKEEAKITAWENLQKAKAEAEIRKLEMKLEKKRESSMERILSRLRRAQKKADHMRQSISSDQDHCVRKSVGKPAPLCRTGKHGLLTGCFPCVVFK